MATGAIEDLTYEQALELFDSRLRSLEEGKLSLEEAIRAVEEGRRYLKVCEAKLEAARHKIEVRPEMAANAAESGEFGQPPPIEEDRLL